MILLGLACAGAPPVDDSAALKETVAEPVLKFRFAAIADPHVYTAEGEHVDRLNETVDWINAEAAALDLRLVLVLGDVAWSEGFAAARDALDRLELPYVPITGDNEIQVGDEAVYYDTFADHYAALADELDGFGLGAAPVPNPEYGGESWFTNLGFTYEGLRFVGVDWAARVIDPLLGERGHLHDFTGGTLPFLREELDASDGQSMVLFSHIPMHMSPGGFTVDDFNVLIDTLAPHSEAVWADLAGHYHADAEQAVEEAGYTLYVTDAVWDDAMTVRIVEVYEVNGVMTFATETVELL